MLRVFCLILLSCFAQQVFSISEVKEKGFLRIAVYKDFPPFSYRDGGRLKGVEVELGKLLAKKVGVDPLIWAIGADENMEDDLRNTIWKGHYLGGGVADVMLHVPINEAFAQQVDQVFFDAPYYKESIVVVRRSEHANTPVMALFGQAAIGVELDSLPDFYLVGAMGGRFRDNVKHYPTVEAAVEALQKGEVRSVVAPRSQIEAGLTKVLDEYHISDVSMPANYQSSWTLGAAIKRNRPELLSEVKKAMSELKAEGQIKALFKKYGITYQE